MGSEKLHCADLTYEWQALPMRWRTWGICTMTKSCILSDFNDLILFIASVGIPRLGSGIALSGAGFRAT